MALHKKRPDQRSKQNHQSTATMSTSFMSFKDIDPAHVVLKKPAVKGSGANSLNSYTSWINYGNGPLRFKLPPGKVGFPVQPDAASTRSFDYQLHAENTYQNDDGSLSLVGAAQRDLATFLDRLEAQVLSEIAKDPQQFHPKFAPDMTVEKLQVLFIKNVRMSKDPKWPDSMKIKLMTHKSDDTAFQGLSMRGAEVAPLFVTEDDKEIVVTTDNVCQVFSRGTDVLPVIQGVGVRFTTTRITMSWKLVHAAVQVRKTAPDDGDEFAVVPKISASDFLDCGWGIVKEDTEDASE